MLPGYPREIHAHLEPTLEPHLVAAIESQQAFLLEHGYIEQAFDVGVDRRRPARRGPRAPRGRARLTFTPEPRNPHP